MLWAGRALENASSSEVAAAAGDPSFLRTTLAGGRRQLSLSPLLPKHAQATQLAVGRSGLEDPGTLGLAERRIPAQSRRRPHAPSSLNFLTLFTAATAEAAPPTGRASEAVSSSDKYAVIGELWRKKAA